MNVVLALIETMLADTRDYHIAARPAGRVALAPVWVTPMVLPVDAPDN